MIKVLQPLMPTTDDLIPYLRRIDENKIYVNSGPLVQELEKRLEQITGVHCAVVSNGTLALELVLKASDDSLSYPDHILLPALTFSATGLAARNSTGCEVELLDVDKDTWQLSSKLIDERRENNAFNDVCAVMPVATFGQSVYVKQWENYDIPVVIDAAGAFPNQIVSKDKNIATCFSLHATKFVGCGEGGFVASANEKLIANVRSLASFGAYGGTNAKMSEYHAAVALASLSDHWFDNKINITTNIANMYASEFRKFPYNLKTTRFNYFSTMLNILLPVPADEVMKRMLDEGIETKQWYRPYLDERPDFTSNTELPVTDHLRKHLIGLPFHTFLSRDDVIYICETLKKILR